MSLKLRKYVKNDIPISFMQNLTTATKMPRIQLLFPKRTVLCFLQFRFLGASKGDNHKRSENKRQDIDIPIPGNTFRGLSR